MAWKVLRQWQMRLGEDWPIFPELDGKGVRVTIEEEVNECCENGHLSDEYKIGLNSSLARCKVPLQIAIQRPCMEEVEIAELSQRLDAARVREAAVRLDIPASIGYTTGGGGWRNEDEARLRRGLSRRTRPTGVVTQPREDGSGGVEGHTIR